MRAGGSGVHAVFAGLLAGFRRRLCRPLFRQAAAALIAAALIAAGMPAGFNPAIAHASAESSIGLHHHPAAVSDGSGGATVPGGHSQPCCMSALGCLPIVGILPVTPHMAETSSSAQEAYWPRTAAGQGITAEPVLAPPIRR